MKTKYTQIISFILFGMIYFNISGQTILGSSFGNINRPTPKFGFNGTGVMPANVPAGASGANWAQQWFTDSVISLNPEILRYPGGTNANHWDWQTGWFMPGYQPPVTPLTLRYEEFAPSLLGCNGEGIFVVNMEMSTPNYEMDGLRHANSLGLHPTLFELGNEHNLDGGTTYPNQNMSSTAYAQLSKPFYDSIKSTFPNSKVCAVGGNVAIHPNWHADILSLIPNIEAFAFHVYLVANNADQVFNVNRALEVPFGSANYSLPYRYIASGMASLPVGKEVWVTEHNLQENQITTNPIIAGTWTHALYLFAMNHYYLSQNNISVIINHAIASTNTYYEAISRVDGHITANGVAMKLMYDVARGSNTCQDINFSGNPSMTYGTTTIPKLVGWKFNFANEEKGFICNFSKDTFQLSLQQLYSNAMDITSYSADTNFVVNGLSSLNKLSNTSIDLVTILPFSFTQITSYPSNSQIENNKDDSILVYPNPVDSKLEFSEYLDQYNVLNSLGEKVIEGKGTQISTIHFVNGVYFLQTPEKIVKFVVQH